MEAQKKEAKNIGLALPGISSIIYDSYSTSELFSNIFHHFIGSDTFFYWSLQKQIIYYNSRYSNADKML